MAVFALSQYLTARGLVSIPLARVLLFVAWLCLSVLLLLVVNAFEIKKRFAVIGTLVLAGILGGLEIWASFRNTPMPVISLSCEQVALPVSFTPGETINVLFTASLGGISKMTASANGPNVYWFTEAQKSKQGGLVYRCDFINDADSPVSNVFLLFKVHTREAIRGNNIHPPGSSAIVGCGSGNCLVSGRVLRSDDLPAKINRIDGRGGKVRLYIWNNNPQQFAEVFPPQFVTLEYNDKTARARLKYSGVILINPQSDIGIPSPPDVGKPASQPSPCFSALQFTQKAVQSTDSPYAKEVLVKLKGVMHARIYTTAGVSPPNLDSKVAKFQGGAFGTGPSFFEIDIMNPAPVTLHMKLGSLQPFDVVCIDNIRR